MGYEVSSFANGRRNPCFWLLLVVLLVGFSVPAIASGSKQLPQGWSKSQVKQYEKKLKKLKKVQKKNEKVLAKERKEAKKHGKRG